VCDDERDDHHPGRPGTAAPSCGRCPAPTAEAVALDILRDGLRDEPDEGDDLDLDAVVAAIRALPPNPQAIRPGRGSLLEALADKITDEPFDLAAWEADWAAVEAELATLRGADDRAAGRE